MKVMVECGSNRRRENRHPYFKGPDHETVKNKMNEDEFLIMISDDRCDIRIKIEVQDIIPELTSQNKGTQILL
jgi:hypothetical protein